MKSPTRAQMAADERGALEAGVMSVEERSERFRDEFKALLNRGHKWDAILLGLANQFDADTRNLNYGRLLGTLEAFQVTYRMAASILRSLASEIIVLDQRHRAGQEKAEEPCS